MKTRIQTLKDAKKAISKVIKTQEEGLFYLTMELEEEWLIAVPPGKLITAGFAGVPPDVTNVSKYSCGTIRMDGKRLVFEVGAAGSKKPKIKNPKSVRRCLIAMKGEAGMTFLGKAQVVGKGRITKKQELGDGVLTGVQQGEMVASGEDLSPEEMIGLLIDDDDGMTMDEASLLIKDRFSIQKTLDEMVLMDLGSFKPGSLLRDDRREALGLQRERVDIENQRKREKQVKGSKKILQSNMDSEIPVRQILAIGSIGELLISPEGQQQLETLGMSESQLTFAVNNVPDEEVDSITPAIKRMLVKKLKAGQSLDEIVSTMAQQSILIKGLFTEDMVDGKVPKRTERISVGDMMDRRLLSSEDPPLDTKRFQIHLEHEFSGESMALCDEGFRLAMKEGPLTRKDYAAMVSRFIKSQSTREVNIPSAQRNNIMALFPNDYLSRCSTEQLTPQDLLDDKENLEAIAEAFRVVLKEMHTLMSDSASRYVKKKGQEKADLKLQERALFEFFRDKYTKKQKKNPGKYNIRNKKYAKYIDEHDTRVVFPDLSEAHRVATPLILKRNLQAMGELPKD
ncbi:MAG: hypothetical protein ACI8RZ_001380 [Myxococcota bacterium]|jgi:hypothetical protein